MIIIIGLMILDDSLITEIKEGFGSIIYLNRFHFYKSKGEKNA